MKYKKIWKNEIKHKKIEYKEIEIIKKNPTSHLEAQNPFGLVFVSFVFYDNQNRPHQKRPWYI